MENNKNAVETVLNYADENITMYGFSEEYQIAKSIVTDAVNVIYSHFTVDEETGNKIFNCKFSPCEISVLEKLVDGKQN